MEQDVSDQATAVTTGAEATEAQAAAAGAEQAQEPAQPQTPAQPQQPEKTGPLGKREALAAAREDARRRQDELAQRLRAPESDAATAAPAEAAETTEEAAAEPQRREGDPEGTYRDSEGRLRHAEGPLKGKFAAADGGELPEEGTEAATAEERAPDAKPEAGAAEPRLIRIDVPEGHAIREMGVAALTAADPQQEQALRALLNGTYTRRQEVEALREKNTELQRQLIQQEANAAAQEKWRTTPEYKAAYEQYEEIRDTVGEDAAKRFWQGVVGDLQKITETEFNERWSKVEAEQMVEARRTWEAETFSRTRERLPAEIAQLPQLHAWFKEEVETLDAQIERGLVPHVKTVEDLNKEVSKRLGARLVREPAAVEILKRKLAQEQAAKGDTKPAPTAEQAVEEFKKDAAQKRVAAPPNPLAAAQHRIAGEGAASVDTTPEAPDLSSLTPLQLRKHQAAEARKDAARYFGNR